MVLGDGQISKYGSRVTSTLLVSERMTLSQESEVSDKLKLRAKRPRATRAHKGRTTVTCVWGPGVACAADSRSTPTRPHSMTHNVVILCVVCMVSITPLSLSLSLPDSTIVRAPHLITFSELCCPIQSCTLSWPEVAQRGYHMRFRGRRESRPAQPRRSIGKHSVGRLTSHYSAVRQSFTGCITLLWNDGEQLT